MAYQPLASTPAYTSYPAIPAPGTPGAPQQPYGGPVAQQPYAGPAYALPVATVVQQPYGFQGGEVVVVQQSQTLISGNDLEYEARMVKARSFARLLAIVGIFVPLANVLCLLLFFKHKDHPLVGRWVRMARISLIIQIIIGIIVGSTVRH